MKSPEKGGGKCSHFTKGGGCFVGPGGENVGGISRYEKVILLLTAGFLLFSGGWFLAEQARPTPYRVSVSQNAGESASLPQKEDDRPDSLLEGEVVDLNAADWYDLQRLPGIGEKRARAILDYREEHGPFRSVEELDEVDGIGSGIIAGLEGYVTVNGREG